MEKQTWTLTLTIEDISREDAEEWLFMFKDALALEYVVVLDGLVKEEDDAEEA